MRYRKIILLKNIIKLKNCFVSFVSIVSIWTCIEFVKVRKNLEYGVRMPKLSLPLKSL